MGAKTSISWDEFLAAGTEGQRWEYVDGEVVFMSPVFRRHGRISMKLDYQLESYVQSHSDWVGYGADTAFTMANGNWRCPDAALVRKERDSAADSKGPTPFAPDIAFEILSPNDAASDVQSKRRDYAESQTLQVWLDPQKKTAEVISPSRPAQHFQGSQALTIPELSDFRLDLSQLFA
jgi:Uma2 family endonuclease